MKGFEPWDVGAASEILARHVGREGATLPMLHDLQAAFGHVPAAAVSLIADATNMSRAEIHGCITFYHDFRRVPAGRHVVKLCRAEACQAVGAEALHAEIRAAWGVDWHETRADGHVTVEPVFCLGLCANGPAALVDDAPVARLDLPRLNAALAEALR